MSCECACHRLNIEVIEADCRCRKTSDHDEPTPCVPIECPPFEEFTFSFICNHPPEPGAFAMEAEEFYRTTGLPRGDR